MSTHQSSKTIKVRHGFMLLWFTDLMNVIEEVTIRMITN